MLNFCHTYLYFKDLIRTDFCGIYVYFMRFFRRLKDKFSIPKSLTWLSAGRPDRSTVAEVGRPVRLTDVHKAKAGVPVDQAVDRPESSAL